MQENMSDKNISVIFEEAHVSSCLFLHVENIAQCVSDLESGTQRDVHEYTSVSLYTS